MLFWGRWRAFRGHLRVFRVFFVFFGFLRFSFFRVFRDFRAPGGFRGFDFAFFWFFLDFRGFFRAVLVIFHFHIFHAVFTVIRRFRTANRTDFHAIIFLVAWRSVQNDTNSEENRTCAKLTGTHFRKFVSIKPMSSGSTPHMKLVKV